MLDILAQHGAKATFFVVGDQAAKHPDILEAVKAAGHAVGGHTMRHEMGWRTDTAPYVQSALASIDGLQPLFRPPYGKMTPAQARRIGAHADLIMWDVLSGDLPWTCSMRRKWQQPEPDFNGAPSQAAWSCFTTAPSMRQGSRRCCRTTSRGCPRRASR